MSKKIELLDVKPWERKKYPELKSKTELQKINLMPGYNVKPRAIVKRRSYGDYYLYDINKTIPYHESKKEKARKNAERKRRDKERTCQSCGKKFHYREIVNNEIPFVREKGLCADCYFKTFQKYKNGIVYDLETTGLYPFSPELGDEILSMCIMDLQGSVLFEHYFKPEHTESWSKAAAINGITPEKVENEKPFSFYRDEVQRIFDAADILITYNGIHFDDSFLEAAGIEIPDVMQFDVMLKFAWLMHEWDDYHKSWRWHKLINCAAYYNYEFPAHDATEDVRATLHCYTEMVFQKSKRSHCRRNAT